MKESSFRTLGKFKYKEFTPKLEGKPVADPAGAKKHEIYAAAFEGHLFYDRAGGWGVHGPLGLHWVRY